MSDLTQSRTWCLALRVSQASCGRIADELPARPQRSRVSSAPVMGPTGRSAHFRATVLAACRLAGAGEERGTLSGTRCGSECRGQSIHRDDEDVGFNALQPAGAHDAQDRQRAITAPAPRAQPDRDIAHPRELLRRVGAGLRLDRKARPVGAIAMLSTSPGRARAASGAAANLPPDVPCPQFRGGPCRSSAAMDHAESARFRRAPRPVERRRLRKPV